MKYNNIAADRRLELKLIHHLTVSYLATVLSNMQFEW